MLPSPEVSCRSKIKSLYLSCTVRSSRSSTEYTILPCRLGHLHRCLLEDIGTFSFLEAPSVDPAEALGGGGEFLVVDSPAVVHIEESAEDVEELLAAEVGHGHLD